MLQMFSVSRTAGPTDPLGEWLLANKAGILTGGVERDGVLVTDATVLHQYRYVISLVFVTFNCTTAYLLPTQRNSFLKTARIKFSLISMLFGCWGVPWGPLHTIAALFTNLSGGHRRTVSSILTEAEWGIAVPSDFIASECARDVIELTESAAAEVRRRRDAAGHPESVAIRVFPTKWADAECEVQFDYPVSDGRDWVGVSMGVTVLIDKRDAELLQGRALDFSDGAFVTADRVLV